MRQFLDEDAAGADQGAGAIGIRPQREPLRSRANSANLTPLQHPPHEAAHGTPFANAPPPVQEEGMYLVDSAAPNGNNLFREGSDPIADGASLHTHEARCYSRVIARLKLVLLQSPSRRFPRHPTVASHSMADPVSRIVCWQLSNETSCRACSQAPRQFPARHSTCPSGHAT